MDPGEEMVALADLGGHVIGSAPRRIVRRDNLLHLATGVIVRNRLGQLYVHRRTPTKDVFPSRYDCCAGGVVAAGEAVEDAARRELAEELGITGVPLRPLLVQPYEDEHTRYVAHVYETVWDGPIRWQPEEVDAGAWWTVEDLQARLSDPSWPFVPDSRLLVEAWLLDRVGDRVEILEGWDSQATLVEGRWIERVPRRPEVAQRLRAETTLLPWLAPQLPVAVPVPVVVGEQPLTVRHVAVAGDPLLAATGVPPAVTGTALGRFLLALHGVPAKEAERRGALPPDAVREEHRLVLDQCYTAVLPRLPADVRPAGQELLRDIDAAVDPERGGVLVHGDLGPEHILVDSGGAVGIIDWTDARVGDAALDLSWLLYGAPAEVADQVRRSYAPDFATRRRALLWHRLGPWHEVLHGLAHDRPDLMRMGVDGVVRRLSG